MARIASAITPARLAAAALLALPFAGLAPASAFAVSCTYDGATKTVTVDPQGTTVHVVRAPGGDAIVTSPPATPCGAATVLNTDKIDVTGTAAADAVVIELTNGPFAPGASGEPGSSDEIELEIDLQSSPAAIDAPLVILGGSGADHISTGEDVAGETNLANLNANEADGIDSDVSLTVPTGYIVVDGAAGADVLSGIGEDGTGMRPLVDSQVGGPGADDITPAFEAWPGPGNDTIRFVSPGFATLHYDDAPNGVAITLNDAGGTASNDGESPAGTDTITGHPNFVFGSNNPTTGDTMTGSSLGDTFFARGGSDVLDGGGGVDNLEGDSGDDTIHGGPGNDGGGSKNLDGGPGDDDVFGDGGDDVLDGGFGTDSLDGGEGNDRLRESGGGQVNTLYENPSGADDLHGGPGTDSVEYGSPETPFGPTARLGAVRVDLDDVADDGFVGPPSEGDNAHSDIEQIVGGAGNDTLVGDDDANALNGFLGADTLRGGGGDDTLLGFGTRGSQAQQVEDAFTDGGDDIDGGPGGDTVFANEGDDKIEAREGTADAINCGLGNDTGRGDRADTINADCEAIALPVEMPPDPPVTPPKDPPVTPPVQPPVVTPPVVTPPTPKVATLLTLPSSRRCASRRKFTVRVRREIRGSVKRVTIFLNGRRVKSVTGSRIGLPIDLRGLPKGKVKVRLRVELVDGRVATDTRTYRTCATKKRKGQFGRRRG